MPRYSKTERIGVNAVERIVIDELGWIFREQPIVDLGIDAHMEFTAGGDQPTGQLVALQIKTGSSHFRATRDAYVYRGKLKHLDYWLGHSLPVVLIAHLPATGETLWIQVTAQAITRTAKAWRIAIPKKNKLAREAGDELAKVFEGTPAQQRLRKLSIELPLMRHIKDGNKVSIELEEWVNKSLGRTTIRVFVDDERDEMHSDDGLTYFTGYGIKDLAEAIFSWATASTDEDFYEIYSELEDSSSWWRDSGPDMDDYEGELVPARDADSYIRPYADRGGGEVQVYRLKLELNDIGEAFLVISDHIDGKSD